MTTHDQLTHSYNLAASQWRTKIEGLGYAAAYRWMIGECGLSTEGADVADIGCGSADFSRALIEVAGPPASLTLVDPSSEMVDAARRSLTHVTPQIRPLISSLEGAQITAKDIVLCAHVIEHFEDPFRAIQLLKNLLKENGKLLLIVSEPHWCNWIIWVRWRHKMIRRKSVLAHCEKAKLQCVWDGSFPAGPPSRTSHAYLLTHLEGQTE